MLTQTPVLRGVCSCEPTITHTCQDWGGSSWLLFKSKPGHSFFRVHLPLIDRCGTLGLRAVSISACAEKSEGPWCSESEDLARISGNAPGFAHDVGKALNPPCSAPGSQKADFSVCLVLQMLWHGDWSGFARGRGSPVGGKPRLCMLSGHPRGVGDAPN